jgi:MFS family permease
MAVAYKVNRYWRELRLALSSPTERNILLLYAEVAAAGIMAASQSFYSAYLLRLGGSNTVVGLLASLPALVAVFCYLPSASLLQRAKRLNRWIVWSLGLSRLSMLPLLLLPFWLHHWLPEASLFILVAATAPSVLFSTGWSPYLADVVPAASRATVLSWRMILYSALVAVCTLACGYWLDRVAFPANYQSMFFLGLVGGALSLYFVARIKLPTDSAHVPDVPSQNLRELVRLSIGESAPFRHIVVNTLLFNLGAWMVGPLYMILFVRDLGATDGWIGLNTTLANVGVMAGYWLWRRWMNKIGKAKALYYSLPLVCLYAFIVAWWPNLTFILAAGFFVNFVAGGVNLSHSVIFLEQLPPKSRYGATAVYSMVMNIGAFVSPLIGVFLANRLGIIPTLVIGGVLRAAGAATFYIWPVTEERVQLSGLWRWLARLRRRSHDQKTS